VLGVIFAAGSFLASSLLGPNKKPTDAKTAPYEWRDRPGPRNHPSASPVRFYLVP